MKFPVLHFIALLSVSLPSVSAQSSQAGNCTIFNWEPKYFYIRYRERADRISAALACPDRVNSTQGCALAADGDLQVSWMRNNTANLADSVWNTAMGAESFLHSLIRNTVNGSFNEANPDFNSSVIGTISQVLPLEPGTSGYINFYPLLRCVQGSMSNCSGGIEDGLGIEACAPVASRDASGIRILDGKAEIQNISESNVGQFRDPFAGQSRGAAGRNIQLTWGMSIAAIVGVVGFNLL